MFLLEKSIENLEILKQIHPIPGMITILSNIIPIIFNTPHSWGHKIRVKPPWFWGGWNHQRQPFFRTTRGASAAMPCAVHRSRVRSSPRRSGPSGNWWGLHRRIQKTLKCSPSVMFFFVLDSHSLQVEEKTAHGGCVGSHFSVWLYGFERNMLSTGHADHFQELKSEHLGSQQQ